MFRLVNSNFIRFINYHRITTTLLLLFLLPVIIFSQDYDSQEIKRNEPSSYWGLGVTIRPSSTTNSLIHKNVRIPLSVIFGLDFPFYDTWTADISLENTLASHAPENLDFYTLFSSGIIKKWPFNIPLINIDSKLLTSLKAGLGIGIFSQKIASDIHLLSGIGLAFATKDLFGNELAPGANLAIMAELRFPLLSLISTNNNSPIALTFSLRFVQMQVKENKPIHFVPTLTIDPLPQIELKAQPTFYTILDTKNNGSISFQVNGTEEIECLFWVLLAKKKNIHLIEDSHPYIIALGSEKPPQTILWEIAELIKSKQLQVNTGDEFLCSIEIIDSKGIRYEANTNIRIGIMSELYNNQHRIIFPPLLFDPGVADTKDTNLFSESTIEEFKLLSKLIQESSQYRIHVQGHANASHYKNMQLFAKEQEVELIPLSLARAQRIEKIFLDLGVPKVKLRISGEGANQALFPFGSVNAHLNRRVELYIEIIN